MGRGADYELRGGRASASLFWNEFRDLIVFDFAAGLNFNVGRARSRGVELSWRQTSSTGSRWTRSYTYLDTEDRDTGLEPPAPAEAQRISRSGR